MTDIPTSAAAEPVTATRIPADIERADQVLGPLTARQAAWLAGGGLVLYAGYWAASRWMSPLAYLALITPIAGVLIGLVVGRREGISLDRYTWAALAHVRTPKRRVHAPDGIPPLPDFLPRSLTRQAGPPPVPVELPCRGIDEPGVLVLGREGRAAVAQCSTVSFDLRSPAEQQAITAGFARWLNALTGPAQILLRSHPTDLEPAAARLREQADGLPHPALAVAARAHADYLTHLGCSSQLLSRQVLLVAREPGTGRAAGGRAVQRIAEAGRGLAAADITTQPLHSAEAAEVMRAACNPEPPADRDDEEEEESC